MLDILFPRRSRRMQDDDFSRGGWIGGGMWGNGARTRAGMLVDENLALTYSALWCGTRLLSETEASLPLFTYRRDPDGDRRQAPEHRNYDLLKSSPNAEMGSMAMREGRTAHQVLWGQGFCEIERQGNSPDAPVANLWPIHAGRVRPVLPADNMPEYSYWVYNNDGSRLPMYSWEILHVPGVLSEDGIWGKSVVAYGRESIGFGLATERHGANHFGSGGQPRVVVTGVGLRDRTSRDHFRREWKELHGSPDSGEIALLPHDAKLERYSMTAEDQQYLQTRKFNISEIARWLRIPVHMLGDLEKANYNSLEIQSLEFVIYSLMPWLHRWEEQCELKLFTRAERGEYFVEHLVAGLLRGDIAARMNAYRTAIMIGVMTINECRRLENLNGIGPAGDRNYVPLNVGTAESIAAGLDQPGNRGTPGSDQAGGKPDSAAAFDRWTRKKLKKMQREDLSRELAKMQERMPNLPQVATREACRNVLTEALGRLFSLEANAARRVLESRGTVEAWAGEWHPKHAELATKIIGPACELITSIGVPTKADRVAGKLAVESKQALSAGSKEERLAALQAWPTQRASEVAARILAGELG